MTLVASGYLLEALAVVVGGRDLQQRQHVAVVEEHVRHGRQQQPRQVVLHGEPEPMPRRVQPLRQLRTRTLRQSIPRGEDARGVSCEPLD